MGEEGLDVNRGGVSQGDTVGRVAGQEGEVRYEVRQQYKLSKKSPQ